MTNQQKFDGYIDKIKIEFDKDFAAGMSAQELKNKYLGRKKGVIPLMFKILVNL